MARPKRKGLGKGLDALLGGAAGSPVAAKESAETSTDSATDNATKGPTQASQNNANTRPVDGELRELAIDIIQRGKYQPRRDMQPEALEELADSIKAQGVMQPIVVRPIENDRYEIIAGERRWRASQQAGLKTIPALIREVPDEAAIAMALIENIQREDLNPMEEALALLRLQEEFNLTHGEVAQAVGKSRSAVSNLLRLTKLAEDVQRLVEHGDLEMGHARSLLSLPEEQRAEVAQTIISRGLSVRQAEALVRKLIEQANAPEPEAPVEDPDLRARQDNLSNRLGTGVQLQQNAKGKGKLVIQFKNDAQLAEILERIK